MLVVDDEWAIAEVLEDILSDEGYRVLSAANGLQALERLDGDQTIDVVLLDFMMPLMDGPATLQAILSKPTLERIPVILMSSLPEESVRGRTGDSVGFLRKPFLIDDVLRAVSAALKTR